MEKLDFIDSKFRLAILAAKRAKQLVSGSRKKIDSSSDSPLTVAMEEIRRGKIKYKIFEYDEHFLEREEAVSLLMGEEDDSEVQDRDDFLFRTHARDEEREDDRDEDRDEDEDEDEDDIDEDRGDDVDEDEDDI